MMNNTVSDIDDFRGHASSNDIGDVLLDGSEVCERKLLARLSCRF